MRPVVVTLHTFDVAHMPFFMGTPCHARTGERSPRRTAHREEVHRQQAKGEQASQFHSFVSKSHSRSFSVQAAASRRAVASSTP